MLQRRRAWSGRLRLRDRIVQPAHLRLKPGGSNFEVWASDPKFARPRGRRSRRDCHRQRRCGLCQHVHAGEPVQGGSDKRPGRRGDSLANLAQAHLARRPPRVWRQYVPDDTARVAERGPKRHKWLLAGHTWSDVPGDPGEQARSQPLLQAPRHLAERRLRASEPGRGPGDAPCFHDRREHGETGQLVQRHCLA